ncbi:MAG: hypothetical protein SNJ77_00545 [Cytophagales bacterium]
MTAILLESLLKFFTLFLFVFSLKIIAELVSFKSKPSGILGNAISIFLLTLFVVSIYAIVNCKFKTSQSFALLILLFFGIHNKIKLNFKKITFDIFRTELLSIFGVTCISFLFFETWNYGIIWFSGYNVKQDTYFYSLISKSLTEIGFENYYHVGAKFSNVFQQSTGYHYTEFWLNNLTSRLFSFSHISNLHSFTFPFFLSILILLSLGIAKEKNSKLNPALLIIALFFVDGIFINSSHLGKFLGGSVRGLSLHANHEFKYYIWYVLVMLMFYFFVLKKDIINAALIAVLACTTSFMYVPIIGFILAFFTFQTVRNKPKEILKMMLINLIFVLIFFQGFDWNSFQQAKQHSEESLLYAFFRIVFIILSSFTSLVTLFGMITLPIVRKTWKDLIFPFVLLFISGFCYFLIYNKHDSHQIFFSTQHAVLFLALLYSFIHLAPKNALIITALFFLIKAAWMISTFETSEYSTYQLKNKNTDPLNSILKNEKLIAVYKSYDSQRFEDETFQPHYKKSFIFFDCYEALFQNEHLYPISVSDFEVFKNKGQNREKYIEFMKSGSLLFNFAQERQIVVHQDNADSVAYLFMKHHQLDKVLHKKDVILPSTFVVKKTVCDTNENCITVLAKE